MKAVLSTLNEQKNALAARAEQALLEQLPVDSKTLQRAAKYLEPKNIKRVALVAVGGTALLSVVGTMTHDRIYRAAMARELKKQLEPIHKKLDELQAQNEVLKRQNEELQKQLKTEGAL